jgi:aspartate/methionine/tyrosine aminotransferase
VTRAPTPGRWRSIAAARTTPARGGASGALIDLAEQNPTRVGLGALDDDARAAIAAALEAPYEPDARGLSVAREAIAGYYAARDLTVDPGDLVLTSGTSEAFTHVVRLLCEPGRPHPHAGTELSAVRAARRARRRRDRERAARARRALATRPRRVRARGHARTRAIVVVQPNHPTGSWLAAGERAALEARCAARGIAIVSDEVFGDFTRAPGDAPEREPSLLAEPRAVPVFVLHGLSKLCGMPQLKLSWIALAGPADLRARARAGLEWIADAFLSVGTPVQRALPRLLEARHAFRRRVLERTHANRDALVRALSPSGAEALPAGGGWVAVVQLPERVSAEALAVRLIDRDVIVHPGHFYDFDDDRHLVVSLLPQTDAFARGAERIAEAVAEP